MKNVIFINSHPIQYFAPLYKYLNDNGIATQAWYGSDESIKGGLDKQFNAEIKWDIPLLEGYKYTFFRNYSWNGSHFKGFWGLINIGMIFRLYKIPKSVIVVHGWHYFSHLMILLFARFIGHTVCLRCEMPQNQELLKHGMKHKLKKLLLRYFLFPRVNYFLNIGEENKRFYESLGVDNSQILFCPYSVDNERFKAERKRIEPLRQSIRSAMGVKDADKVILYSGKYISKKRPLDLLQAFIKLNEENCWLIMVGEGALRFNLEKIINDSEFGRKVILTGFVNQSQISTYYSISDVFVMCSSVGETWGLSINEAMNFNLPIIVSTTTGSSKDLVEEGANGFTFKTGDVANLACKLNDVLYLNRLTNTITSDKLIERYSFSQIYLTIKKIALT